MDEIEKKIAAGHYELIFTVRKAIRYHSRRRQFYKRMHTLFNRLMTLGCLAIPAIIAGNIGQNWKFGFACMIAVLCVIDRGAGIDDFYKKHDDLIRKFSELEKAMIKRPHYDYDSLMEFMSWKLDLELRAPIKLTILDHICHNEMCRAMGYDKTQYYKIKWYQRLFCNFSDILVQNIEPVYGSSEHGKVFQSGFVYQRPVTN